jgi:hypothetical protein
MAGNAVSGACHHAGSALLLLTAAFMGSGLRAQSIAGIRVDVLDGEPEIRHEERSPTRYALSSSDLSRVVEVADEDRTGASTNGATVVAHAVVRDGIGMCAGGDIVTVAG